MDVPLVSRENSILEIQNYFQITSNPLKIGRIIPTLLLLVVLEQALDELPSIIEPLFKNINKTVLPIKVSYTNGPISPIDFENPTAANRILYAFYNSKIDIHSFLKNLPWNWKHLDLVTVFKILNNTGKYIMLLIDEFQLLLPQKIEENQSTQPIQQIKEKGRSKMELYDCNSVLQQLIVLFSTYMCTSSKSFWMAIAGTYVGVLQTISTR
eukprot:TRINITY_DN21776_c0_g1_i1.p1 TRINITY_DN21776_c0_g1~~TRINITY_DN21776_c0_g1_i1.p1  ORF type:complete len:211 (+),score=43.18 TRINITY_DN21776_c0_g1_i1:333-965(+)